MKHLKMLGLLAVAAASLLAFAGNAYAANPVLTSPSGTDYTGPVHITQETGTTATLSAIITDTCTTSTLAGEITVNANGEATGPEGSLSFGTTATPCAHTTKVIKAGTVKVTTGGTVTITGNEVTVAALGSSCIYGGGTGTDIGKLVGGTPAKLAAKTTELKRISGSGEFCAANGTWEAHYVVTTPSTLLVD